METSVINSSLFPLTLLSITMVNLFRKILISTEPIDFSILVKIHKVPGMRWFLNYKTLDSFRLFSCPLQSPENREPPEPRDEASIVIHKDLNFNEQFSIFASDL